MLTLLLWTAAGCGSSIPDAPVQTPVPAASASASSSDTSENSGTASETDTQTPAVSFSTTPPVSDDSSAASDSSIASDSEESMPETSPVPEDTDNKIVQTAEGLIGIDFAEGGASPAEGFDNSGFIYYVLRENGYINCPRQISAQLDWGETADYDQIKPGDVVYFSGTQGGSAEFGGIYAGGGIMIYSPFPGEKVKTTDITANYWTSRFVTALSL